MLKLVKPSIDYKNQYIEMMKEWESTGEKIIPASIRKDYTNFTTMLKEFYNESNGIVPQGYVAATTLWAYDDETNKIVGAVNIRHTLNESLLKNGGHIRDGVRPSERRKGYATKMIQLALNECEKLGITKVLMVCYKDNIGSAKSIQKNGGILENEIVANDGKIEQRYWIYLENDITIRPIEEKDLVDVVTIQVTAWKTAYKGIIDKDYLDSMTVEEKLEKKKKDYLLNKCIVAELNNEIVGFCRYIDNNSFSPTLDTIHCELTAIYVKPELKYNGIGTKLFTYVINEFKQQNKSKMILWCLKENYNSRKFYEKMGGILSKEEVVNIGNKSYIEIAYEYDL
ncbi:MAG: GNAT family N-acetyltransferase [Clostridia bacterium]